jgi:hypothetical protein
MARQKQREDRQMTDRTRSADDGGDDRGIGYDRESTGRPRWVKLTGLVVAVVVVLVIVIMLMGGGGGGHGPQRHGGTGGATPPATVTASAHG